MSDPEPPDNRPRYEEGPVAKRVRRIDCIANTAAAIASLAVFLFVLRIEGVISHRQGAWIGCLLLTIGYTIYVIHQGDVRRARNGDGS